MQNYLLTLLRQLADGKAIQDQNNPEQENFFSDIIKLSNVIKLN